MISYFRKAFANKHAISRAQKMKPLRRFPTLHEQSSQVKLFARTFRSITTCKHPSAIVSVSRVSVPVPLLDVSTCSIMVFISHFMLSQSNSITTLQCFYGNGNGTELSWQMCAMGQDWWKQKPQQTDWLEEKNGMELSSCTCTCTCLWPCSLPSLRNAHYSLASQKGLPK